MGRLRVYVDGGLAVVLHPELILGDPDGYNVRVSPGDGVQQRLGSAVLGQFLETGGKGQSVFDAGVLTITDFGGTPAAPADDVEVNVYLKGGNFVLQYSDGGTVRYKYLDLTGTGVTWVHSTTPP